MVLTEEEKRQRNCEKSKKWRLNNPEKVKQINKDRKEYQKEYMKIYNQTEEGKKNHRIHNWKQRGVKCEDWDKLYNIYLSQSNCELCNVELTEDKVRTATTKCLDHDHKTGEFRNIVCHSCNIKIAF